jgi:hypothetical protein
MSKSHQGPREDRPRHRWLVLGAAFIFGAGSVFIAQVWAGRSGALNPDQSHEGISLFDPRILDPEDPSQALLRGGEAMSLARAEEILPVRVLRPQHSLAADSTLTQLWIGSAGVTEVAMRYESGVRVYLTVWPPNKDPASFYRELASEGGVGEFSSVSGHPAWVVARDEQAPGWPPSSVVDMTIGRVEVSIHGRYPTSQLVAIAETVG